MRSRVSDARVAFTQQIAGSCRRLRSTDGRRQPAGRIGPSARCALASSATRAPVTSGPASASATVSPETAAAVVDRLAVSAIVDLARALCIRVTIEARNLSRHSGKSDFFGAWCFEIASTTDSGNFTMPMPDDACTSGASQRVAFRKGHHHGSDTHSDPSK
jgi:hypothetical protein